MSVRVSNFSRLRFGTLLLIDGIEHWDILEFPAIEEQPDDRQHQLKGTDRLDSLALAEYGDPNLASVIAVANGIEDMLTDLNRGDIIRIPSARYVKQELFQKTRA